MGIWQFGAVELAARIRAGEIGVAEATEAALGRLEAVNPSLNAVVARLNTRAREAVRRLEALPAEARGPLHGVPVTVKVNTDQQGEATTHGVKALAGNIAPADAPVVRALEAAGAVIIGRTNTPEFSFRAETDGPLHGRTRNPWGDHLSAGGSSGGAASAVMAGIGALAQGNDIAGSLRLPAFSCGAVAIKPGLNRVASHSPSARVERAMLGASMAVQGLIAREARDLAPGLAAIIGPDAADPFHAPLPFAGPDLQGPIRIGWSEASYGAPLTHEIRAVLRSAREALGDAGYLLEEIDPPGFPEIGETAFRALMSENMTLYGADFAALGSPELQRVLARFEALWPRYGMREFLEAQGRRQLWAREWSQLLQRCPLVLAPLLPAPFPGPNFDLDPAGPLDAAEWCYGMNFLGLPAGVVPARLLEAPQGPVPLGVQIIGRRWREDLVIAAMAAIEDRLGRLAPQLWARMG